MLAGVPALSETAARFPANSMRWVGGGAMTVAVAYSLVKFLRIRIPVGGETEDDRLIEPDARQKKRQLLSIVVGMVVLLGWLFTSGAPFSFALPMAAALLVMAMLMVALGAILSLQIGSSASPVSGTIFVTTLVLCLVALATGHRRVEDVLILTPLLVAACVAVCTANDSSQDYKTLQLCGVRVQDGFLAQLLGLIGGCLIVPVVLYVADEAYVLGSPDLPAPQGKMFATLIDGLLLQSNLPWAPIFIGLGLGAAAVALDVFAHRKGHQLPAMAVAVGIYLPAAIGIGILLGAGFRRAAEGRRDRPRHESILAAAGLITGSAALDLVLGILILLVAGFDPETSLKVLDLPSWVTQAVCVLGILTFGWILWTNSKVREE
jgi:putative OPT family oligopeptide transporter